MSKPSNPPMFWHRPGEDWYETEITLRDLFAGMAMKGLLANPSLDKTVEGLSGEEAVAADSYVFADAMLAARES